MFTAAFTVRLTQNNDLNIKITDIENSTTVYKITYFIYGYTCNIQPLYINDDNNEILITSNNFKPGLYKNGIIFRVSIKNYAQFTINYNSLNTMNYTIYKINKKSPDSYQSTISDSQSYYLKDEYRGFIHRDTTEVILDYLISYSDLVNELNYGNHLFTINLDVLSGSSGETTKTQYTYEYTDTPDTQKYIICLPATDAGTIYTEDPSSIAINELEESAFFIGNKVTLKFRPFNYSANEIQISYKLENKHNPNNIITQTSTFSIQNGRYTTQSFDVYEGINKLIINDTIIRYYYGKKLNASISWYNKNKLGDTFGNISKNDWIKNSFFRFKLDLSENLSSIELLKTANKNGFIQFFKNNNTKKTIIDLWGNNIKDKEQIFTSDKKNDMHFAIGFQYSYSNDINDYLFSLKDNENNTIFTIYQNNITYDHFLSHGTANIYIPNTVNFSSGNNDEYHLLDIYIRKLNPMIIPTSNPNNPEKMDDIEYNIWEISNSVTTKNDQELYYVEFYIDGIADGIIQYFSVSFPYIRYIEFNNINIYYNLLELAYINNSNLHFTDVDVVMYWYSYKLQLTEDKGISDTNKKLITSLSNIEARTADATVSNKSLSYKHNLLKIDENYLKQITLNSYLPIYIFNVRHLNSDDQGNTIFLWINKQYKETGEHMTSWPIASSTNEDGTEHYTGISYIAPGSNNEVKIKFPKDNNTTTTWDQAQFKLDIQGSSTRGNHGKNLTLGLNKLQDTTFLFSPNFKNDDSDTYLPEEEFTLKADIVDSGHSNNTVMGKFINDNTTKFETYSKGKYTNYIKNCLEGFPCIIILNVDYEVSGTQNEYYFLGIYNFNLGRGSYSNLGYRDISVFDDGLKSVSDENPFIFFEKEPEKLQLINNFGGAEITGNSPKFDFSQWDNTILFQMENESDGNKYMWDDIVTTSNSLGSFQTALQLFIKDVALSGGYIFNYLGKTLVDHTVWDNSPWTMINSVPDPRIQYMRTSNNQFNEFIKKEDVDVTSGENNWMYIFDKTMHDTEIDSQQYRTRLDYTSALEYYVICMTFGLVDSVQKNLNVKTWTLNNNNFQDPVTKQSRAKFYIAFYDMDTCLGIDNDSNETSPFCFSDFWYSKEEGSDNLYTLTDTAVYRDFYDVKLANEIGYDIPSSSLFSIVKYGTSVYKKAFPEKDLEQTDYPTPTDLWARYRLADKKLYDLPGTGCLPNVDYFMNNYYKKHLEGASEIIFNLNYDAKYFVYNYLESWEIPNDIKNSIGTYKIQNTLTGYQEAFHQDATKFRGRSINRIYDWLNSRIHILDAYFNLQNATEFISVSNDEKNAVTLLNIPEVLYSYVLNNEDVYVTRQIFNPAGRTKMNLSGTITLQLKALKYTPIMCMIGGTIYGRYLLKNPAYTYTVSFSGTGNVDAVLAGSNNLTYISDITWVTPVTLTISSKYLTYINGNSPNTSVTFSNGSIDCQSIQNITLTGKNYKGSLKLTYDESQNKLDTYANLQTINLSGSQISLAVSNEPVSYINMSNVNTTSLSVYSCNKLIKPSDNKEAIELTNAVFTSSVSLHINWSKDIQLDNFETPELNISCTYPGDKGKNTIVIDGSKYKQLTTLKNVTINGYKIIKICNIPNLQNVTINDPDNVEMLIIGKCCTYSNLKFTCNSNTIGLVDLSKFTSLTEICFSQTLNFERIILPNTVNLKGGDFSYCTQLKYVDVVNNGTLVINGNGKRHSYTNLTNNTILDTGTDGIFYGCNSFTLSRSESNNGILPIKIGSNVTSLSHMFCPNNARSNAISFEKMIAFIDSIPQDNNITDISYMFADQTAFKLTKELYIADTKANKSTLKLGKFHKVSNAQGVFYSSAAVYINQLVWYESNQKKYVFGGDSSVTSLNISYIFNNNGSFTLNAPIDIYYPILKKITNFGNWWYHQTTFNPIYTNTSQTFKVATILTEKKKQEAEWKDKQYYTRTYTYSGTCGERITSTVSLRNVFIDETKTNLNSLNIDDEDNLDAVYPEKMTSLQAFSFGATSNNDYTCARWNLYGFITKKWNISLLRGILNYNNGLKVEEYEDVFANKFMPTNLKLIYDSLQFLPIDSNKKQIIIDVDRFFDFDTYMNQAAQYNNDNNQYIFYNSFRFSKLIYSDIFKKWLIKIIQFNNTHIPYIHNVFSNTKLIVTSNEANNECDFKLSTIFKENKKSLKENNNIKSINSLFYNLHCYENGRDYTDESNILYMQFGYDIFKIFPKLTSCSYTFANCYLFEAIPFNVFNKRQAPKYYYYYKDEGDDQERKYIKYIEYNYSNTMENVSYCFSNTRFYCKYKANNSFNIIDSNNENVILTAGVNSYVYQKLVEVRNDEGELISSHYEDDGNPVVLLNNLVVYNGKTGQSSVTLYPSTEYTDTLNLHGTYFIGSHTIANKNQIVDSFNQQLPISGNATKDYNYNDSLIVPPDLLYGCTSSATFLNIVEQNYTTNKLIGIIPEHLIKNIQSINNNDNNISIFNNCIIIPRYIGTYVQYAEKEVEIEDSSNDSSSNEPQYETVKYIQKTYNIYSFIPEHFVTNNTVRNLYGLTSSFNIHWPKQSSMINGERVDYDFYVMSTTKSFHNQITNISFSNYNYNYNYNYNEYNRGIHFNLQCTYTEDIDTVYSEEQKKDIFGELYEKYPNICRVFNTFSTGINLTVFKNLYVTNLINSIYILHGYFGNIIQGATVENLKINSNGYCINISNNNSNNSNSISCNAIFPSMNKNITNFININNYRYYLYNTQVENSNIKYYQNVYSNYLIFRGDTVQRPQYLDIE